MTHNGKNALGVNQDSSSAPSASDPETELPKKTTFRFRVVEHFSWDAYDEDKKCFKLGHKDNKAIAGRKFKVRMPNGNVIEKTTDENGVIEFVEQDPCGKYEVIFEPAKALLNNNYYLFYDSCPPLEKLL